MIKIHKNYYKKRNLKRIRMKNIRFTKYKNVGILARRTFYHYGMDMKKHHQIADNLGPKRREKYWIELFNWAGR